MAGKLYRPGQAAPSDLEQLRRYLNKELQQIGIAFGLVDEGETDVASWAAVADPVTGTISGDFNAMDWTGHPHADEGTPTALYMDLESLILAGNQSNTAYIWVGPKDVTVGVGGNYVATEDDFQAVGTNSHPLLVDRDLDNQHPMSAITGLITDQQRQDSALSAHIGDQSNPHNVAHDQLLGVTPDQHHNQLHSLYGSDHPDVLINGVAELRDGLFFNGTDWQRARRMNWRFEGWVEGNTYYKDDVVFGGSYTMIANTDDTIEYPFPQPVGDIAWAVFGDNAPAWEAQSTSTTRLLTGIKITPEEVAAVSGLRVWIPLLDPDVAYLLVTIVEGKVPRYQQLSPTDTGWWPVTFDTTLLGTGVPVEIYLVTQGQGTTSTTFTHNWTYRLSNAGPNPNNPPTLGQFRHFSVNAPDIAYLNKTDADGVSRKGDLDTLQAGDTIAWTDSGGVDVFFTLTADPVYYNSPTTGDEDFYELNISPAVGQGSNGTAGMTFVHFLDRPTSYVRVANEFAPVPAVVGLLSTTGNLADVVETVDAYGIDVLYQEVHFPVDWDVVSAIGTGGGGGGGDFTPTTFAGAGTTGYVPDPGTSQAYFLRDDGTWAEASGGGGGTFDHTQLINRDVADQHPTSAITGLDDAQQIQDNDIAGNTTAIGTVSGDLADHEADLANPHQTSWSNLTGTPPDFGGQVNTVVGGTDITVDATDPVNPIVNFSGTIPPEFVPTTFAGAGTTGYVPDPLTGQGYFMNDSGDWVPVPVSPIGGLFLNMRFDSNTDTSVDPGSGEVRLNAGGDHLAATELSASETTRPGNNAEIVWDQLAAGDYIGIWETGGDHEGVTFVVTGPPIDQGTWVQVPISAVGGQDPTQTDIDNNSNIQLFFIANPNRALPQGGDQFQVLTKNSSTNFDDSWQFVDHLNVTNIGVNTHDQIDTHIDTALIHFDDAPADDLLYARKNLGWEEIAEGGGGGSTDVPVIQPGHGFALLDCIRWNGTAYVKALANDITTMALGVVVEVDGDNFTYSMTGQYNFAHGLTPDEWYYLSDVTPGLLTPTAPAIEQPIVYTGSSTALSVYAYRPSEQGESDSVDSVFGRTGDIDAEVGDYSAFYATAAQGLLADSAVQPGDNLSTLTNDEGFVPTVGATQHEVVAALPGTPDPNVIYYVTG